MAVSFGSLATGQVVLGARDPAEVVTRAAVGAGLAELTARFLGWVQTQEGSLERPIDPLLLASYGTRELERLHQLVLTAQLRAPALPVLPAGAVGWWR